MKLSLSSVRGFLTVALLAAPLVTGCQAEESEELAQQEGMQNQATPHATLLLRSGERLDCTLLDMGAQFTVSVHGEERRYDPYQVALIDLVGSGTDLPEAELSAIPADGSSLGHLVVRRDGGRFSARLLDLSENPMKFVFETSHGEHREAASQIARVYMAERSFFGPPPGKSLTLSANASWVDTGLDVSWGQTVFLTTSGTIQLSGNVRDKAGPDGSVLGRFDRNAPLPNVLAGALIGKIVRNGTSGPAFDVGGLPSIQTNAAGRLLLGINESPSWLWDNSGSFDVRIQ
jgi:hypothetical protein